MGIPAVLFPVGLIAALAALAMRGGEAVASDLPPKDKIEPKPGELPATAIQIHPGTGLPQVQPMSPAGTYYPPKPSTPGIVPAKPAGPYIYKPPIEVVDVPGVGPLPRVVSFADYERDRKRKMKTNNCGPGMRPEFDPYTGTWAEYRCVPEAPKASGKTSAITILNQKRDEPIVSMPSQGAKQLEAPRREVSVSKIVAAKESLKPAVKEKTAKQTVTVSRVIESKPSAPSAIKKDRETGLPVVQRAEFESEAKPFVEEAVKSRNAQMIRDAADSMRQDFPRAAAYLDKRAVEFVISARPSVAKTDKPLTASIAQLVSKKQWEEDKVRKSRDNSCADGTSPKFKPYSNSWAEYTCDISPDIARGMQALRSEGIELDVEVSVAVFLSKRPAPSEARAMAQQYSKSKPKAAARLNQYAKNQEAISDAMARGKPTKPVEIVKAANATKNPSELLKHAKTLEATGNTKAAATVKSRAKEEATKQGITIIDDAKANSLYATGLVSDYAEGKRIVETLRKSGFPKKAAELNDIVEKQAEIDKRRAKADAPRAPQHVEALKRSEEKTSVVKVSDAQAKADADKVRKQAAADKVKAEKDKKTSNATKILVDKDKAEKDKVEKAELERRRKIAQSVDTKTIDPLGDLEAKIEASEKERRQKAKKAGVSGFEYEPSEPLQIVSPIDGVDDIQWAAFVKSMTTGKANTVTPAYQLGMFAFGARRLADYGLVDNPRQVSYHDNTVWAGDWVEPWTLQEFLNDARAQYELFVTDMSSKASYIKEKDIVGSLIDGRKASLSGLLAVAFKTTEGSFGKWLGSREDRQKFPATMQVFEKANGLF